MGMERAEAYGEVRFLEQGELPILPKWVKCLPPAWQERYTEKYRPYRLERQGENIAGILQVRKENAMTAAWRQGALSLLEAMEREGVSIVIPPAEGEFPRERLPFAQGRKLAALFAFQGAQEALRRQGKETAAASYLIVGGNPEIWRMVCASMGNEVNRLSIFTAEPQTAEEVTAELYAEHGLLAEVFSSPKNPAFRKADAVLNCGMEQRAFEHILKKGCFWLDLAGNRPSLRRILQNRTDVAAAEGFFFHFGEKQLEGRYAEAEAYLRCEAFRESWTQPAEAEELLSALMAEGFAVSGFSAFGKRVKIRKKQG